MKKTESAIPKNLDECFEFLKRGLGEASLEGIKKMGEDEFLAHSHHGLGTNLRNEWGLWHRSELADYFDDMGVWHADDMSGIILCSFHRHLMGKDIDLDGQVAFYKDFWAKQKSKSGG